MRDKGELYRIAFTKSHFDGKVLPAGIPWYKAAYRLAETEIKNQELLDDCDWELDRQPELQSNETDIWIIFTFRLTPKRVYLEDFAPMVNVMRQAAESMRFALPVVRSPRVFARIENI